MPGSGGLGPAVVDGGNPKGAAETVAAGGGISDGGSSPATSYCLIEAASLDAAVHAARGCPALAGGCSIEVAETFDAM